VAEVAEGTVLDGRYRITHRIGSGGMADVWAADDSHLQRRVAVKVLHSRLAQDATFVERFRREAEAAAGLQHPNIVGVFDRGNFEGTYYIAMEYLDGRSLAQLIDAGLSPPETISIVRQILEAAAFAHRHGIVHRDFKPQNVIVNAEGKATVTDFGIARAGVSEITQTGSVMGTAHYLSPEQAQGLEVTASSDLYSIGVLLYECLTGKVPFEGDSAVTVALKQVSQVAPRPSSVNPEVSPALDAVVMRALEKDPARRFRDAEAFIAALDAAVIDPGAPAAGNTAAYAAAPIEGAPPPPVAVAPVEEKRRRPWWFWVLAAVIIGVLLGGAYALFGPTGKTTIPEVTSQQLVVASQTLNRKGFDFDTKYVRAPQPRNTVLEQSPIPGEAELSCKFLNFFCSRPTVDLTVSNGPGKATVPPVSGLSESEARKRIRKAGLKSTVQSASSADIAEGDVIKAAPGTGTSLVRGQTVTITVSTGPQQISVPSLIGRNRASAVGTLRGKGLVPSVTEQSSTQPSQQVLSQSPSGGTSVDAGSTVSLVVSSGPKKESVPDVVGRPRPDAVTTLRNKGFVVVVNLQDTSDQTQSGLVIDESPAAGSTLAQGETVTLTVGHYVKPPTTGTTTTTPRP